MIEEKSESQSELPEKFVKTKAIIAIMIALTGSLKMMGFDIGPILKAKESLAIAKIDYKKSMLDIELKKLEFEMYIGNSSCEIPQDIMEKIDLSFRLSHGKGK